MKQAEIPGHMTVRKAAPKVKAVEGVQQIFDTINPYPKRTHSKPSGPGNHILSVLHSMRYNTSQYGRCCLFVVTGWCFCARQSGFAAVF